METRKSFILTAMAVIATFVMIESCSKSSNGYGSTQPPPSTTPTGIMLSTSNTLGSYLADNQNHALYFFSNDANGADSCTGACALLWPPFNIDQLTQAKLGAGLNLADFGTVTGSNGKTPARR